MKNITGALVALLLGAFLYGKDIEEYVAPPLGPATVDNVARVGSGIYWTVSFCKLRDLRMEQAQFIFTYVGPTGRPFTGQIIPVHNRSEGRPAGNALRPVGCFDVDFSAELPSDAQAGDRIIGEAIYPGLHGWWKISSSLGEVVVP